MPSGDAYVLENWVITGLDHGLVPIWVVTSQQ